MVRIVYNPEDGFLLTIYSYSAHLNTEQDDGQKFGSKMPSITQAYR